MKYKICLYSDYKEMYDLAIKEKTPVIKDTTEKLFYIAKIKRYISNLNKLKECDQIVIDNNESWKEYFDYKLRESFKSPEFSIYDYRDFLLKFIYDPNEKVKDYLTNERVKEIFDELIYEQYFSKDKKVLQLE